MITITITYNFPHQFLGTLGKLPLPALLSTSNTKPSTPPSSPHPDNQQLTL